MMVAIFMVGSVVMALAFLAITVYLMSLLVKPATQEQKEVYNQKIILADKHVPKYIWNIIKVLLVCSATSLLVWLFQLNNHFLAALSLAFLLSMVPFVFYIENKRRHIADPNILIKEKHPKIYLYFKLFASIQALMLIIYFVWILLV